MSLDYPETRRDDVVEDLHGVAVPDPYRWLEDTVSDETTAWIKRQNELTESVLAGVPARAEIREQLTALWDHQRFGVPFERGGRWFQSRNDGLQPQSVLYVMDSPADPGRVLLDPNGLSEDGTVALVDVAVSPDGGLLAYATSAAGSDWMTWRVREVDSGRDLPDVLEWSKFSTAAWLPDGTAFFYSAVEAPAAGREFLDTTRTPRVVRHQLGADPGSGDVLFDAADHPEWIPHLGSTDDSRFVIVVVSRGTFPELQLHVFDTQRPDAGLQPLVPDFIAKVAVVGNIGSTFYLSTDLDAERGRIVAVDLDRSEVAHWNELIAETTDTLVDAWLLGGRLVVHYLHDAHSVLRVFDIHGIEQEQIPLPGLCSVTTVTGHADSDLVLFGVTSFTEPDAVWQHDLGTRETSIVHAAELPPLDVDVVTEQMFVTSDDGTRLPVFLVHRTDVEPTGDVPTLLYGYGGFNIPTTPTFDPSFLLWARRGGLLAIACIRGGGEYGRAWYDAGRLAHKQNGFDDFCAVARWLGGESGWSRAERIGILGGSNGGLLVGACLTQHPELFGAAVPIVGVLDMLRFHLFTIGWAWASDYGDPNDADAARTLMAYSPLHNIRAGTTYPATLVMTGDHDDRVAPGHSFKFAAALQAAQSGPAPVLIRVETSAGHGAGKPTGKQIDEGRDLLTFLERALGV